MPHNEPFDGECDIHTSEADDFLELSRNDFTGNGHDMAQKHLSSVLLKAMPKWLGQLRDSPNERDQNTLPFVSFYAMLNGIQCHGDEWQRIAFSSGARWGREPPPSLDLGTIASAVEVTAGHVASSSYNASIENGVVILRGPAMDSRRHWLATFLMMFFPSRTLDTIIEGPHRHYRLKKGPAEEDVADEVLLHLLAPNNQGFAGKRRVLPCPKRFAGLAYYSGIDVEWRTHGWDDLILSTMASPFVCKEHRLTESFSFTVEIPNIQGYVHWLAKQRSEPECQIAELLLDYIRHIDKLMKGYWQGVKQYDLKTVESDLRRIT